MDYRSHYWNYFSRVETYIVTAKNKVYHCKCRVCGTTVLTKCRYLRPLESHLLQHVCEEYQDKTKLADLIDDNHGPHLDEIQIYDNKFLVSPKQLEHLNKNHKYITERRGEATLDIWHWFRYLDRKLSRCNICGQYVETNKKQKHSKTLSDHLISEHIPGWKTFLSAPRPTSLSPDLLHLLNPESHEQTVPITDNCMLVYMSSSG